MALAVLGRHVLACNGRAIVAFTRRRTALRRARAASSSCQRNHPLFQAICGSAPIEAEASVGSRDVCRAVSSTPWHVLRPGPLSRYSLRSASGSRSFGQGPKYQRRGPVAVSREGGEAGRDHRSFVDRRVVAFLEVAQEPTRRNAGMPTRILARDQERQLMRLAEPDPSGFFRGLRTARRWARSFPSSGKRGAP
jgi:hypothetical protein